MPSERTCKGVSKFVRLFLAGLLLASCSTVLGLSDGTVQGACTTDSECAPGYGCLLGSCRDSCSSDADCGTDARCLKTIVRSVCIPNTEGCGSGCPEGTQCVDHEYCRTICAKDADCNSGQTCTSSGCVGSDPAHDRGSGGVAGASGSADAGAGGVSPNGGDGGPGESSSGAGSESAGSGGEGAVSAGLGGMGAVSSGSGGTGTASSGSGGTGAVSGGSGGTGAASGGSGGTGAVAGSAGSGGGPAPECVPNPTPTACQGATPRYCDSKGKWQNVSSGACSGSTPVCVKGNCGSCTPSPTPITCSVTEEPQFCNDSGVLQSVASGACAGTYPYCLAGACVVCKPNATPQFCANNTPQFCAANGQYQNVASGACPASAPVCNNGNCSCSQTVCGSSCVDLNANANHCGTCGHSCQGGGCAAGKCKPVLLATTTGAPLRLAVNSKAVFWVNQASPSTVSKVGLDGTGLTALATNASRGWGIAVDETAVYWSAYEPSPAWGVLRKVGVSGGSVTTLMDRLYEPREVAIDANNVYFTGWELGAGQIPKAGGTAIMYVTSYGPWSIFADSTTNHAYVLNYDLQGIQRFPIGGGAAKDVLTPPTPGPKLQAIAARAGSNVVFTADTEVRQVSMFGGAPTVLAPGQTSAYGIASDNSGVYWTSRTASGTITRYDASGVTTLATGQDMPAGIALDATTIYWINSGSNQIMKLAK